jgi:hypothetical protein
MSFRSARENLDTGRQSGLDLLLAEWDAGPDVAQFAAANMRAELGSSVADFTVYLALLADNRGQLALAPPGPAVAFQTLGTKFGLQGHDASRFTNLILGRAILLVKYARYVAPQLDALGCYDTEDEIRANLRALDGVPENAAPPYLRVYFVAIRRTPLGRGTTFATLDISRAPTRGPWSDPPPRADAIRNSLALGEDPVGNDYILFAYQISAAVSLRVPYHSESGMVLSALVSAQSGFGEPTTRLDRAVNVCI